MLLKARDFCQKLGIEIPIIQAPMAGGPSTPELAAAVGRAGALGFLAAGYLAPAKVAADYARTLQLVDGRPVGINFFVAGEIRRDLAVELEYARELSHIVADLGIHIAPDELVYTDFPSLEEQLAAVRDLKPPIITFTFGLPERGMVEPFAEYGALIGLSVTSVAEAIEAERWGADFLIAQGPEAGGHRAVLDDTPAVHDASLGLVTLLPLVVDACAIPVVAAGGLFDGRGVAGCLVLGASAVQMGTIFLVAEESGANSHWKRAILQSQPGQTTLTRAFSGRTARGLRNRTTAVFEGRSSLPAYPVANQISARMRAAASRQGILDAMSLWAGQGSSECRAAPAATIVQMLWKDALQLVPG